MRGWPILFDPHFLYSRTGLFHQEFAKLIEDVCRNTILLIIGLGGGRK